MTCGYDRCIGSVLMQSRCPDPGVGIRGFGISLTGGDGALGRRDGIALMMISGFRRFRIGFEGPRVLGDYASCGLISVQNLRRLHLFRFSLGLNSS